jgi:hypothetical protein
MHPEIKGPGRPPKEPANKRSERLNIRFRPAALDIVDKEADRRGSRRSRLIHNIGFEEIVPQNRPIPQPNIYREMMTLASDLRDEAEEAPAELVGSSMQGWTGDLLVLAAEVKDQSTLRQFRWDEAQEQNREESATIRFRPRKMEWLEQKAGEQGWATSSFLRAHVLEGIKKRTSIEEAEEKISQWEQRAKKLAGGDTGSDAALEAQVRRGMKEIAKQMEEFAREARG